MSTVQLHYKEQSVLERAAVRLGELMVEWGTANAARREAGRVHAGRLQAKLDEDAARRAQVWGRILP